VVAGSARGRRLKGLSGLAVRPTADRVKEALFSILASRFALEGGVVLDLFSGTGALGIEALSRGASRVVFVEQHRPMARVLGENLEACGFRSRAEIRCRPVKRALAELEAEAQCFAGVLLDPPYGRDLARETLALLGQGKLLADDAWVAVEHDVGETLPESSGALRLTQERRYGKTALSLYVAARSAGE
jgi:16S rRNA (guanine(966)-N(2))-methyltransferase RsmD